MENSLKKGLVLLIMNLTNHYLEQKMKKVIGLMKDKLGGKIKICWVESKTIKLLDIWQSWNKKTKRHKKVWD